MADPDPTDFDALVDEVLSDPVARAAYYENENERLRSQNAALTERIERAIEASTDGSASDAVQTMLAILQED